MKRAEAERIIAEGKEQRDRPPGYRVSFEVREGSTLVSGFFPDYDEPLYPTEAEAWDQAAEFNLYAPSKYVNLYVIDQFFIPVKDYRKKMYRTYPPHPEIHPLLY